MSDSSVPVIILSERRDDVEFFNKTMRGAGHAVRCRHLIQLQDIEGVLAAEPQLVVLFADAHSAPVADVAKLRQTHARMAPLIVIRNSCDEDAICDDMRAGAQDLVSINQPERICAVCIRELRSFKLRRALNEAVGSVAQHKLQIKQLMAASADAIAVVQEGIVVEANRAWADLFSGSKAQDGPGPIMDLFPRSSRGKLKGALGACAAGRWDGSPLEIEAVTAAGPAAVKLKLEPLVHEGEPAARLTVPHEPAAAHAVPRQPAASGAASTPTRPVPVPPAAERSHEDPVTGLYSRKHFLERLKARLEQPADGGACALAFVRPDKFTQIERQVGPIESEDILAQIAQALGALTGDDDLSGRFAGSVLALVLERDSLKDIETWAEHAVGRIAERVFEVAEHSLSLTCTIGLTEVAPGSDRLEDLIKSAERATQLGRQQGGNKVILEESRDESTRIQRLDAIWVRQIKAALVEGRFRLAHLTISSLSGQDERMLDTLLRMIDEQGEEVAAGQFMTAAKRHKLLRALDRWVIGASIAHCASHANDLTFIKLSHESLLDPSILDWVQRKAADAKVKTQNLCFQVTEDNSSQYEKQTLAMGEALKRRGFRFAVEKFGLGRDPIHVLESTPMDFVKFDGALMQGIAGDMEQQDKVKGFVETADRLGIGTIASHVEDANTMATLFRLGIGYMEGHYLQEPEVVLESVG